MRRTLYFAYGIVCYLSFLAVLVYSIGFIGNVFTPTSLDAEPSTSTAFAMGVNCLLLALFALQHSGMARPSFKRWWTKYVPAPIERSTYLLFTNIVMLAIFVYWHPIGVSLWRVEGMALKGILYALFAAGWALVFYATCLLNHFELFGLRQVYLYLKEEPYTPLPFGEPGLYRFVRHPLYVGWLMVSWFTPTMTLSHLCFAIGVTGYILVAVRLEERNLSDLLPGYDEYRRRVPMLLPSLRR
jgi:protein-S-isoprenylcysteine O-methyltransferase Ste14